MWKGSLFVHCTSIVPIDSTKGIKMLYVFVDIKLDATQIILSIQSDTLFWSWKVTCTFEHNPVCDNTSSMY